MRLNTLCSRAAMSLLSAHMALKISKVLQIAQLGHRLDGFQPPVMHAVGAALRAAKQLQLIE